MDSPLCQRGHSISGRWSHSATLALDFQMSSCFPCVEATIPWFMSQKTLSLPVKHHFQPPCRCHNNSSTNADSHEAAYASQKTIVGLLYLRDRTDASLPSCCIRARIADSVNITLVLAPPYWQDSWRVSHTLNSNRIRLGLSSIPKTGCQ